MYVLANINFQIFEVGNTVGRGISISSQRKKNLYYSTRHYLLKKVKDIFHLFETMTESIYLSESRRQDQDFYSMTKSKYEMSSRLHFATNIAHFFDDIS